MKVKLFLLHAFFFCGFVANAGHWFVNATIGDDTYDGSSPLIGSGLVGPKKSISNALMNASGYDTIFISDGLYAENLFLDKPIVILGNNWGINPLTQTRSAETQIVPVSTQVGSGISGNSLIEIASCCVVLDGMLISGNSPNIFTPVAKYNLEYESSYGIAGRGAYDNLSLVNLIISNFSIAAIHLSSGIFTAKDNMIKNCKIAGGDQNSTGIMLSENFYSNISLSKIDSCDKGLVFENFSDKNQKTFFVSYMNIRAEKLGVSIKDFTGNTDSIIVEYNVIYPLSASSGFRGLSSSDNSSIGYLSFNNNQLIDCFNGIYLANFFDKFETRITSNSFNLGGTGLYIDQSLITPTTDLYLDGNTFTNLGGQGIYSTVEGDLITLNLNNTLIQNCNDGIILIGNSNANLGNTQFDNISNFYLYLDSTLSGLRPINTMDGTNAFFDGVQGNSLSVNQAKLVENKIHHYLDQPGMAWVLYKTDYLFVTSVDGNNSLGRAIKVAASGWNIYLSNVLNTETAEVDKGLHLFSEKSTIGKLVMSTLNEDLYLHGTLNLSSGLVLFSGIIETGPTDTLNVTRSKSMTVLDPGSATSYVRGQLFIKYSSFVANDVIKDIIPIGVGDDYRPAYVHAIWTSGLNPFTAGFNHLYGKAPIGTLPSNITHISDIRFWEINNPENKPLFSIQAVGFFYDTLVMNDYVNDPANLRVIYSDGSNVLNLGGSGTVPKSGSLLSASGNPGYGIYTFGNFLGGNNTLSANRPIAVCNTFGHCTNDSILFTGINSSSEWPIQSYKWDIQGPSTVASPEVSSSIKKKIAVPGNYLVTLIIRNSNGFEDTTSQLLKIDDIPKVNFAVDTPCFPNPISFVNKSLVPPTDFILESRWKLDTFNYTGNSVSFTPLIAGSLSGKLKIMLNTGCSDTLNFNFISPTRPIFKLNPNGTKDLCDGDSLKVKVTSSTGKKIWNDGNTYDSLLLKTATFKRGINYASNQCFASDSIKITILERPSADAGPPQLTLPGKAVVIKGQSNGMVEWIPETWLNDATITTPTCRPLSTTKYTLRAYNKLGCESTDTVSIFVNTEDISNFPNLLTPNGDGHNDLWVLSNIPDPQNHKVYVFNRESQLIYSSNSYNNAWDGKRDTDYVPDGYYVYVIENNISGKVYSGILNILR